MNIVALKLILESAKQGKLTGDMVVSPGLVLNHSKDGSAVLVDQNTNMSYALTNSGRLNARSLLEVA